MAITNGNTVLTGPGYFVGTSPITDLAVEDLDEDGDLDIMTTRCCSWFWTAFMMNGQNFFSTEAEAIREGPFSAFMTPRQVITDDFDHDGRPRLLLPRAE